MTDLLSIYTLGNFQVVNGEDHVTNKQKTSSKRWKLFQYLLTFNEREISREELILVLKLHKNDDPEGALSALVYRLRKLLSKTCNIPKDHLIKTTGSAYKFK
jgi:two-component SAPR family response regulator